MKRSKKLWPDDPKKQTDEKLMFFHRFRPFNFLHFSLLHLLQFIPHLNFSQKPPNSTSTDHDGLQSTARRSFISFCGEISKLETFSGSFWTQRHRRGWTEKSKMGGKSSWKTFFNSFSFAFWCRFFFCHLSRDDVVQE